MPVFKATPCVKSMPIKFHFPAHMIDALQLASVGIGNESNAIRVALDWAYGGVSIRELPSVDTDTWLVKSIRLNHNGHVLLTDLARETGRTLSDLIVAAFVGWWRHSTNAREYKRSKGRAHNG